MKSQRIRTYAIPGANRLTLEQRKSLRRIRRLITEGGYAIPHHYSELRKDGSRRIKFICYQSYPPKKNLHAHILGAAHTFFPDAIAISVTLEPGNFGSTDLVFKLKL